MQCPLTSASYTSRSRRHRAELGKCRRNATTNDRRRRARSESRTEGGEALAVSWYAVWTHSHCEQSVSHQLSSKGFAAFLPEMHVWSKRAGGQRLIRVPMFPGYLFVHDEMDKTSYIEILKSRGVVRILEDGWTRLTPVPDAEIDAIQQVVHAEVPVFAHDHLAEGDRVQVVEGPLSGIEGVFVQDKLTKGRLVLTVDLLGRSVAVEVDCTAVRSIKGPVEAGALRS